MVTGGWEYARVTAVEGRWVVDREDGVPPPDLEPYADLSKALFVLDEDGWLLDPAWQPEWPYVSLRRRRWPSERPDCGAWGSPASDAVDSP